MFTYIDRRPSTTHGQKGIKTDNCIEIYDGGRLVGGITPNYDVWYIKQGYSFSAKYYHEKYNRFELIDYHAKSVADAKRIFSEWYKNSGMSVGAAKPAELPSGDNSEFFPTPGALAGKMANYVDWKNIVTVLEPSAGKGDLMEYAVKCCTNKNRGPLCYNKSKIFDAFDVIERDLNLQMILNGKGYHLVSDDFLTYTTPKHYDLILMNPPFSNGDEHLLHAIQMQKRSGGQVCCLLNAETIRNPFTNRRKLLKQILSEYNATVEFVSGAFERAERRSSVEVAIVYLNIPKPQAKSNILENLRKEREQNREFHNSDPKAVAKGDWLEQMVDNYNFEAQVGIDLMEEFNALTPYFMSGNNDKYAEPLIRLSVCCRDTSKCGSETINGYLGKLRLKYWENLLRRPELTEKMTSRMRDEFYDKINEMKDYDFSLFNVRRFVLEIGCQLTQGVEDAIVKLFDDLSAKHSWYPDCENNIHYFNGWKTNEAHKVGMKAILPINGYSAWGNKKELRSYEIGNTISDLERALTYLDKGEVEMRYDPETVVNCNCNMEQNVMHFTYFTATFYKKGTCHIKFHKEAAPLIDRLNIFASMKKSWLPPCYGKKAYQDMDAEEKAVIDEFQGETSYREVMRHPEQYIIQPAEASMLLPA